MFEASGRDIEGQMSEQKTFWKCPGCNAEFKYAIKLTLFVTYEQLMVSCPVCGFLITVRITERGRVEPVSDDESSQPV